MVKIKAKRLFSIACYLAYTLVVLLFMLWFQFPATAVKARMETELNRLQPGLQWRIGSLGLRLPRDILVGDIEISETGKEGSKGSIDKPLLLLDALSLRPDVKAWRKTGTMATGYRLAALGGRIDGELTLAANHDRVQLQGVFNGVDLNGLKKQFAPLERTMTGILSGHFKGSGSLGQARVEKAAGAVSLKQGSLSLQEPVLGMDELVFSEITSDLKYENDVVRIEKGTMQAKLLAASFSGTLQSQVTLATAGIQVQGELELRPEFLTGIGNPVAIKLLKSRLKDGKLPFTINGTLQEPGIVFAGLPADLNKKLQRGRKLP